MQYIFRTLLITAFLSAFTACQTKKSKLAEKPRSYELIDVTEIYDRELVNTAREQAGDTNMSESNRHFLKALDLYRNKKQARAAVSQFRKAITMYPSPKAYYELGNALLDIREYDEASSAYEMAVHLGYDPVFNVFYNLACVKSMMNETGEAFEYLESALEAGYYNKDNLLKDKDLANLRKEQYFSTVIVRYFKDDKDQQAILFECFLKNFSAAPGMPYRMEEKNVCDFNYEKTISYDFSVFIPSMEDSRFSRDAENEYTYGHIVHKTDSFIILSYQTREPFGDTLNPTITYLAVYDNRGNFKDEKMLGGNLSGNEFSTGEINDYLVLTSIQFFRVWKDNPKDGGYQGNTVVSVKPGRSEQFRINASGKFEKYEQSQVITGEAPGSSGTN